MSRGGEIAAVAASIALTGAALADGPTVFVDFENGQTAGWTISGGGVVVNGGNPGRFLRSSPGLDTFAPIARSPAGNPDFSGDYRAMNVSSIGFDAQTIFRDFGSPVGFEMSLLLRDTHGTPSVDDDDFAYFVGPEVPQIGEGWVGYGYLIPSESTDPLPAGWTGGWSGDPEHFRPGVDWNDVIVSVDQVEFWWIHPAFFAIFAMWDVGVDNINIKAAPPLCPFDLDGDGSVGINDLLDMLAAWGDPWTINDLLDLLAAWGPC